MRPVGSNLHQKLVGPDLSSQTTDSDKRQLHAATRPFTWPSCVTSARTLAAGPVDLGNPVEEGCARRIPCRLSRMPPSIPLPALAEHARRGLTIAKDAADTPERRRALLTWSLYALPAVLLDRKTISDTTGTASFVVWLFAQSP